MLNKLLKYDLKYMLKNMGAFYILSIFCAILTRIFFSMKETVIVNVLGQISVGAMFAMLINTLINTIIRSWVRFKESVYGDESYLTHTLPVSKNSIYQSKFVLTIIYLLAGFLVVALSLFIAYYTPDRYIMIKDYINEMCGNINVATIPCVISFLVIIFLELFNTIQCGFLGLIKGYNMDNNKKVNSLAIGFITYFVIQMALVFVMFIMGLFIPDVKQLFISDVMSPDLLKLLIVTSLIFYTVITIVINFICVRGLKRGVNVE